MEAHLLALPPGQIVGAGTSVLAMRLTMAISGFPHIMLHWIVLSVCSHTTTGDVNQPEVNSNNQLGGKPKLIRMDCMYEEAS